MRIEKYKLKVEERKMMKKNMKPKNYYIKDENRLLKV